MSIVAVPLSCFAYGCNSHSERKLIKCIQLNYEQQSSIVAMNCTLVQVPENTLSGD